MKLFHTDKYDDIIQLPRPASRRAKMSRYDRAAQFSPFAALTGFEEAIAEAARLTDQRIELDEGAAQLLDAQMQALLACIQQQPLAQITWFRYDQRKAGGSYVATIGHVKKIDTHNGKLLLTDGQAIPLGEIFSITVIR